MRRGALILLLAAGLSGCLHRATPEEQARMIAVGQALQGAGAAMRSHTPEPAYGSAPSLGAICYSTAEWTSGLYKTCAYNCPGGTVTRTLGAADLCPITVEQ